MPKYRVRMRYPDGKARNAEALAVDPAGTVYILTKTRPSEIYRLKKEQWMNPKGKSETLEFVTSVDFHKLERDATKRGALPTAMDISPDGTRLLVLTYQSVFEARLDFSKPLKFQRIDVVALEQQEAIAYTPDGNAFIFSTEKKFGINPVIMKSECRPK